MRTLCTCTRVCLGVSGKRPQPLPATGPGFARLPCSAPGTTLTRRGVRPEVRASRFGRPAWRVRAPQSSAMLGHRVLRQLWRLNFVRPLGPRSEVAKRSASRISITLSHCMLMRLLLLSTCFLRAGSLRSSPGGPKFKGSRLLFFDETDFSATLAVRRRARGGRVRHSQGQNCCLRTYVSSVNRVLMMSRPCVRVCTKTWLP